MSTNQSSFPDPEEWPLTSEEERTLILIRFCGRDDLFRLGSTLDVTWFADRDRLQSADEDPARESIVEAITTPKELMSGLNDAVDEFSSRFGGFWGYHYHCELDDDELLVTAGPATDQWQSIVNSIVELTENDSQLYALIRGIVEDPRLYNDYARTDFGDAVSKGTSYYDGDGNFWPSNKADQPGQIPGMVTWSTGGGRGYRVAQELLPLLRLGLDHRDDVIAGPVHTPDQDVPDELDRRVPKFEEVMNDIDVTDDDIHQFEEILDEHDAIEYWKDYIAPTIKFRQRAKKAVLCMLASPDDEHGTKGRTNAIIYGPPGTGKTAFRDFLVEEFGAFSVDGSRVSKADLTYNKNTNEDGVLVRAHKGLAVIEEADEMREDALGAALTALGESGQIEIRDMRLPAEVRGIMLGNYRSREEIVAKHSEALFNRFEFVLYFDRLDDDERDAAIDWQYDYFRQAKDAEDTVQLKKYIAWVRDFHPSIPDDELEQIKRYKRDHIEVFENVREGISVLNVAYTIARLNHRDVTLVDYNRAFNLITTKAASRDGQS